MRLHEAPPARALVPTLTLATFVNHLNVIAWNPFLPFIPAELGVAVALLGQVPALMMLLATSLGLVIGPFADGVATLLRQVGSGQTVTCSLVSEPGTDLLHPLTEATKTDGGWLINGQKSFGTIASPQKTFTLRNTTAV